MGLKDLLDMSEVNARPHATPKHAMATRLETKTAEDRKAKTDWEACKKRVDKRDKYQCRKCERKVVYTLELQANRAEHHHIVRRTKERALLTDDRNIVLLCHACHEKVTHSRLHIVGLAANMFKLPNGKRYLNANKPLTFMEAA